MARILEEQAKEIAQGRTGLVQDAAFHGAMASSAHNRAISRIDGALMDLLTQSREESLHTPGRPTRSHEDHQRILEAIRRRDEVGAHRAVLDHLTAVERLVMGTPGGRVPGATEPPSRKRRRSRISPSCRAIFRLMSSKKRHRRPWALPRRHKPPARWP